jgi:hypothetical protein
MTDEIIDRHDDSTDHRDAVRGAVRVKLASAT